jgi:hypothetical protein
MRNVVYSYADSAKCSDQAIIITMNWEEAGTQEKMRVLTLLSAMVELGTDCFTPRSLTAYIRDATSVDAVARLFISANYQIFNTFDCNNLQTFAIDILGVIGDPTLRAVAWIRGGLDATPNLLLYDSCMIFLSERGNNGKVFAVPSTRVFSKKAERDGTDFKHDSAGNSCQVDALFYWLGLILLKIENSICFKRFIFVVMNTLPSDVSIRKVDNIGHGNCHEYI